MADDRIEIVPFENFNIKKDGQVYFDEVSITYGQNPDCTEDQEEAGFQEITLSTKNNGMARFINIKTENWSVSDGEDLLRVIEDFQKRAQTLTKEKK